MATLLLRRALGALSTLLLTLLAVTGLPGIAHAEEGFEYWNYFHEKNGTWEFAQTGPAEFKPADGSIEAFRYGTSTVSQGIEPRVDLAEVDFDTVCEGTEAGADEKRVAVLLDFGTDLGHGTPPDPRAECAVVAESTTTQQVLDEVADVRVEGGMTCGIDGYPADGCGVPVKDAKVATDEQPVAFAMPDSGTPDSREAATSETADDSGVLAPLLGVALVVLVIAGGAFALGRRNKTA